MPSVKMDQPWKGSFKFAHEESSYSLDVEFPLKENLKKFSLYRKYKTEAPAVLVELNNHALGILAVLAHNRIEHKEAPHFVTVEEIRIAVWGTHVASDSIYTAVNSLRDGLQDEKIIETKWNHGYRLAPDVEATERSQNLDRDVLNNARSDRKKCLTEAADRHSINCHYFKTSEAAIKYLVTQYKTSETLRTIRDTHVRFGDYDPYLPETYDEIWNGVSLFLERCPRAHVDVLLGQTVDSTYESELFVRASEAASKGRYTIRKLKGSGLFMNFLILQHEDEEDKEVFFGWGRQQRERDDVIHFSDQRLVRRFSAFYNRLFSDEMSAPVHDGVNLSSRSLSIDSATREILGWWTYEVRTTNGQFSHNGRCEIFEDGGHLRIRGERVFKHTSKKEVIPVNHPWHSDWCQICSDHEVRFICSITIEKAAGIFVVIRGLCQVKLDTQKMIGHYDLLPPFEKDTPNIQSGTIVFTRSHDDPTISPPDGFCVGDDVANS